MANEKLTIKQEKYVQGLFAGLSQREAYKQAGYNIKNYTDESIDVEACKLANNTKVVQRLEELKNELKERNMVTVEKVLAEMAHIADLLVLTTKNLQIFAELKKLMECLQ